MGRITISVTTVLFIMGANCLAVDSAMAVEGLDSAEIKKLRYISRSILKSRAQEKQKIEKETAPERQRLQAIQLEIEELARLIKNAQFEVSLTKVNSVTRKPTLGRRNTQASNFNENTLSLKQQNLINTSLKKIVQRRTVIEDELPKFWQFWKKKTPQDYRKETTVQALQGVEDTLSIMNKTGNLDGIASLKKRLSLIKKSTPFDTLDPTFQTRTKHRNN